MHVIMLVNIRLEITSRSQYHFGNFMYVVMPDNTFFLTICEREKNFGYSRYVMNNNPSINNILLRVWDLNYNISKVKKEIY